MHLVREGKGDALTGVHAGRPLSREIEAPSRKRWPLLGADALELSGRQHRGRRVRETFLDTPGLSPEHARKHLERKLGDPVTVCERSHRPRRKVQGRTPMMYGDGKSHRLSTCEAVEQGRATGGQGGGGGKGTGQGEDARA